MPARRQYQIAAVLTTAATLAVSACSTVPPGESDRVAAAQTASTTVARASLTSVVTTAATVQAGPTVVLTTPSEGIVGALTATGIAFTPTGAAATTLTVPSGVTVTRRLVGAGRHVPANYPVAEVRVDGFALVATLDLATLYRLYAPPLSARGQITNGPGPFDCALISRVPMVAPDPASAVTVTCVPPTELRLFAGMPAVMALTTIEVRDALLLPVEAVAGSAQRGSVLLIGADGRVTEREVRLGPSDGARIQILDGLAEGDRVRLPGPDLAGGGAA